MSGLRWIDRAGRSAPGHRGELAEPWFPDQRHQHDADDEGCEEAMAASPKLTPRLRKIRGRYRRRWGGLLAARWCCWSRQEEVGDPGGDLAGPGRGPEVVPGGQIGQAEDDRCGQQHDDQPRIPGRRSRRGAMSPSSRWRPGRHVALPGPPSRRPEGQAQGSGRGETSTSSLKIASSVSPAPRRRFRRGCRR